jgi:GT2 family glycosyltransferase
MTKPPSQVRVSIIVVSKDEPLLADTLQSLRPLVDMSHHEVLVIDASKGSLSYIQHEHPWVRWFDYEQPDNVRVTIAHQRNLGVAYAQGEIIVFIDSGCLPADEWLTRLLQPILDEGEVVSCGSVISPQPSVYSGRGWGNADDRYITMAPTINMAFLRAAFDTVGGFDESFAAGEDLDFSWRLTDNGYRLRWAQDAIVTHEWGSAKRQLRRSMFYGRGWSRLLKKHPHRIGFLMRENPVPIVYALFVLGLPLTLRWRYYPLLLLWPIWRQRNEELPALVLLDHLVVGAGVLDGIVRPGR